jgi:hypothetical protein
MKKEMFIGPYVIALQIRRHNLLPLMAHVTQHHADVTTLLTKSSFKYLGTVIHIECRNPLTVFATRSICVAICKICLGTNARDK